MIKRVREMATLGKLLRRYPILGIIGARQVGKTTLGQALVARQNGSRTYFGLENPKHLAYRKRPGRESK